MLRRFVSLLLLVLLCVTLAPQGLATEDEEEVSIADVLGVDDPTATADPTAAAQAPVDRAAPVYEVDGSILLTLTFTGDFTIGDNLQSKGKSIFEKELEKQNGDINFPFRNFRDILLADDLTVLNFEGTFTTAGRNPNKLENQFLFRADPALAPMLPNNGVECVSLENNHVLDMGEEGLAQTKQTLTGVGVQYYCETEPLIFTLKGVKMGMLAYQTFDQYDRLFTQVPTDVAALKAQGCELVVVSFHWGAELDYAPNDNQQKMARLTIDAGADLVVGHHSHRINPIEIYNGKYIAYSLGNFSFAGNSKPDDMSTFVFQIKFRVKDGTAANEGFIIIPARISSNGKYNDFIPTPYTKQENIESVLSVLRKNGQKLQYPVSEYPLAWPGDE